MKNNKKKKSDSRYEYMNSNINYEKQNSKCYILKKRNCKKQ